MYGGEKSLPYAENLETNTPLNLYAATKKSNELLANSYAHLFKLKSTGLRFFTVYGPMGRPDMAYFKFSKAMLNDESIDVYGEGKVFRDFTYIDDIVNGICAVVEDKEDRAHEVLNIGCGSPDTVEKLVSTLESKLGLKAKIILKDLPKDDMPHTYCCVNKFKDKYGFKAETSLDEGLGKFVEWYKEYVNIHNVALNQISSKEQLAI